MDVKGFWRNAVMTLVLVFLAFTGNTKGLCQYEDETDTGCIWVCSVQGNGICGK